MNNYGRNQMNNRTRQGNMQYNRMNRNNCGCNAPVGCVEARTGNDNCGCNASVGCVDNRNDNRRTNDNCGCNNNRNDNRRTNDNCGCNTSARPVDNCGCNNNARPTDSCGCDHHDHDHDHHHHDHSGTEGCNASRYDQLSGMALAMSYVPWQTFCKLYEVEEARCQGTIFKELDLDFMRGCCS